jgi:uncharacterized protein (UPF0332 family)
VTSPYRKEIQANLDRSTESIEAAKLLLQSGFPDFAASRAYYAIFYAATALLLQEGQEFSKHSGVIAAIHRQFIRSNQLPKEMGKTLNWLFELRSIADYGETQRVPTEDAELAIQSATSFVQAVRKLIES